MYLYWTLYIIPALAALNWKWPPKVAWAIFFTFITLVIGLRYQVGGDWGSYTRAFIGASQYSVFEVIKDGDPGFHLLNLLAARTIGSIWLVNIIVGAIFTAGLIRFSRSLPDPLLALTIAIPYMVIVLGMGYTRQAAAFGFLLWALVDLRNDRKVHFAIAIAIAVTFHKSAVMLLPLAALSASRDRFWTILWVGVASITLYFAFLAEQAEVLWANYVEADYAMSSTGGPIRVAMNFVPAVLFLLLRRRYDISVEQHKLWFWIAVLSIMCLPLVFQAPTAVDRVALYFMPIQLFVFSHLPGLFHSSQRHLIRICILAFYGLVMFVWLNYATHADAWLPYRFWPLVG